MNINFSHPHARTLLIAGITILATLVVTDAEATSAVPGVSIGVTKYYTMYKDVMKTVAGKLAVFATLGAAVFTFTDRKDWSELLRNLALAGAGGVFIIYLPNLVDAGFSSGATL